MQEDIARTQASKERTPGMALPPVSPIARPPAAPKETPVVPRVEPLTLESPPPLFTPEASEELIAQSVREGRQRRMVRIGVTAVAVILVGGGIGFAAYRWLLPALAPEGNAPPPALSPQPGPALPPQTPAPAPQAPAAGAPSAAPSLEVAFLKDVAGSKQAILELRGTGARELETALALEPVLAQDERLRELSPQLSGEENVLALSRFVELFLPGLGQPVGFGQRLSVIIDKNGKALLVEVEDETQAAGWLMSAEGKLAENLTFLFSQPPRGPFGAFRAGRPIPGTTGHRFALIEGGESLDYAFSGKVFIIASNFETFSQTVTGLSQHQ